MNKTGRPVSPHVQIYQFPIGALSSITTRVTGILLSFGALGVGGIDLIGGSGSALSVMESIGDSSFLISGPAKLAVAFPIVYHSLGGMRHFIWDQFPDKFLDNEMVPKASQALFGSATLISLGLMIV
ncbi:MAG: succinate dehydrogenase (ubiquinone) cytochrome b560 subunit [Bacillariaceae sp.]|jgi:succinate dehydrogenase (ubiquinone) cytochrome b560 subunit